MAQGSRQIQSQAQQQIQTLSPQQILVVKLLELPAVELEDRIHAELLENPALEEGKEDAATDEYADGVSPEEGMDNDANDYDSLSDYLTEDDIPDYKLQENNRSRDEQAEDIPFSDATSFYEILKEQLRERNLTEHQCELVEYLNHCTATGKKLNVSEDVAAAMFPALITFCYDAADMNGKRFFWEYILESNSLVFEDAE